MSNNPTKPVYFGNASNVGFGMDGDSSSEGPPLSGFQTKAADSSGEGHDVVMPLNFAVPTVTTRWSTGVSGEGIISVAGKESKGVVSQPHGAAAGCSSGTNDAMLSLELGKSTYFAVAGAGGAGSVPCAVQASGPSLPRKHRSAGQATGCQVEGCKSDLSTAKDYHRRHKVCSVHSKEPCVTVRGVEQRFCQQCSRFHDLNAFDGDKRSCRNRLEGHNKRRRKPPSATLGLSARFLPAYQDSGGLGRLLVERSAFLPDLRISGVSSLWDQCNPSHQRGTWPQRMLSFEDQSNMERSIPAIAGSECQLFSGLHHTNDRSTIFPPPSPKGMIPVSTDVAGAPKTHQYFQGSANPLGPSLSLTSSPGAGVLSGLEAIPVGQGFSRVSDSGRALSLQSTMQLLSCTQGIVAESLDMTSHSSMMSDQGLHNNHIPTAQPLEQGGGGGPHHHFGWQSHDKLLSTASNLSSTSGYRAGTMSIEKDHLAGPFTHSLTSVGNYECVPLYSIFHHDAQDVKPTIDLMQVASSPQGLSTQSLGSNGSFDLGISHFQELQALRSYEPSIYGSQQM